ncbi:MAG: ribosome assembly RNA-binding protein YhbY [Piscirickettsiaceae bacterium]|jgi:RNA-binding protein|nr:ribosome assembly RNA-binding protein YhbY [Piscirickettsiaceae bacterium]
MAVNDKQKRYLRGLAHPLKSVVMLGNKGLTETVQAEIDNALSRHELIKVKVSGAEKTERLVILNNIAETNNADIVMSVGHVAAFYRPAKEPVIKLPR